MLFELVKNSTPSNKIIQGSQIMEDSKKAGQKFSQLVEILDDLRGVNGCPWDREQDERTIANYFLEEVYESIEALFSQDVRSLAEELGDVLMEVVFLSRIAKEKGNFTISDILDGINQKMIRRHPHVFGGKRIKDSASVWKAWNRQKLREKKRKSVFDSMPKTTPSLLASFQIGLRASSFGFDWKKPQDVLEKLKEEVTELEKAVQEKKEDEMTKEVGDVLFSLVNVSRHLGVNPEIALRQANKKFIQRFQFVENRLKEEGKELKQSSLEEMDKIWEEAKKQ
jgi:tetrapyrrole methylase family protein/MazG family protein